MTSLNPSIRLTCAPHGLVIAPRPEVRLIVPMRLIGASIVLEMDVGGPTGCDPIEVTIACGGTGEWRLGSWGSPADADAIMAALASWLADPFSRPDVVLSARDGQPVWHDISDKEADR